DRSQFPEIVLLQVAVESSPATLRQMGNGA
ncbi:hypothetical protein CCACVL1_10706, partial [Corchorus capsularis]